MIEQPGNVLSFNGERLPLRNIIGSWNLDRQERILLFAHWDTRPFADRDTARKNEPIDGANDGGSGVGILLGIARHLAGKEHGPGVDILFTDVEDHGEPSGAMTIDENSMDTWCLGSRYWARNPHVPGYTARFGIVLDMAGAVGVEYRRVPHIRAHVVKARARRAVEVQVTRPEVGDGNVGRRVVLQLRGAGQTFPCREPRLHRQPRAVP